jgi:hypothetical protein
MLISCLLNFGSVTEMRVFFDADKQRNTEPGLGKSKKKRDQVWTAYGS